MAIDMMGGLSQHQLTMLKNKIIQQQSLINQLEKNCLFSHRIENYIYAATFITTDKKPIERNVNIDIKSNRSHFNTLLEIDSALSKMEHHSYGVCIDCKKNIGFKILNRYPCSIRCLRCQPNDNS